ncbi:hypothetical protein OAQ99_07670 [Candidatus Kapabacteria bacterium]|nr:hypothetical protein [Candidatus Kapabacteria bacterium]
MTPAKLKIQDNQSEQLQRLATRMESTKNAFLVEIEKFVANWIVDTVDKYITFLPEIANIKSKEELAQIRYDAKYIGLEIAQKVSNIFSEDKNWWHLNRDINDKNYYKTIDNLLTDELKIEFGRAGSILNSYGFLPAMVIPLHGFISVQGGDNTLNFKYLDPIQWSRDSKRLMDNYWEDYKFALKLI